MPALLSITTFAHMPSLSQIREQIETYIDRGDRIFASSSFQGHSVPLLHIISTIDRAIPVYYVDTGYLFPETLIFRDRLGELLGLKFIGLRPSVPKSQQRNAEGELMYTWDPDRCCHINKVQPMERILAEYDIWVNGVRGDQSATRKAMQIEQPASFGCTRYHPMLDWSARDIHNYRKEHDLPPHPLEAEGYLSLGCEPCTRKLMDGYDERTSRWFGLKKTECGLNTDLGANTKVEQ